MKCRLSLEDGDNADVRSVLQKYEATGQLKFLQFSPKTFMPTGYQRLCAHYGWAFSQIFDIASDFFSYFQATLPLYWDDFLRRTDIRLERQCLRPEVSRTHTFGEKGVSRGQYYKAHLVSNHLNEKPVDWTSMNLSHVATPAAFDAFLTQQVNAAKKFRFDELEKVAQFDQPVAIRYDDKQWKTLSRQFNGLPSGV
eukprot:g15660.t1